MDNNIRDLSRETYYALVWATVLESKDDAIIEGDLLHQGSKLPEDARLLYGMNSNDVARVKKLDIKNEVTYDVFTTRQSVKFNVEVNEYILHRDVRIIIWEGSRELNVSSERYRVISPGDFDLLARTSKIKKGDINSYKIRRYDKYKYPELTIGNLISSSEDAFV